MQILNEIYCNNWDTIFTQEVKDQAVEALETGKILHFPQLPFLLSSQEKKLLSPIIASPKSKNISFDKATGMLRGANCPADYYHNLKEMVQRFAHQTGAFLRQLIPSYTNALQMGRTSFRPVEISGRTTSYRKDDTRLHVDAFPATPNHGRRILRIFTNINPYEQGRIWRIGEEFPEVVNRFLPNVRKHWSSKSMLLKALKITKEYRTEYDHIMLKIHDSMKADLKYQQQAQQQEINFMPGSTWIVQTDQVSHAAMSGQHVLEQTFYLPVNAMIQPERSPLKILEKVTGRNLANR